MGGEPDEVVSGTATKIEDDLAVETGDRHSFDVAGVLVVAPAEIGKRLLGISEFVVERYVMPLPVFCGSTAGVSLPYGGEQSTNP
jgi:hypothetical protein